MIPVDNIRLSGYRNAMREYTTLFKALSDETRVRILMLLTHGELCVCDLMEVLDLPQSTVSRHLATLRHAGLVEDRRQGTWNYYRLVETSIPVYREFLDLLSGGLEHLGEVQSDRKKLKSLLLRKKPDNCQQDR
jgi:ArsR family transcriptional regulator